MNKKLVEKCQQAIAYAEHKQEYKNLRADLQGRINRAVYATIPIIQKDSEKAGYDKGVKDRLGLEDAQAQTIKELRAKVAATQREIDGILRTCGWYRAADDVKIYFGKKSGEKKKDANKTA